MQGPETGDLGTSRGRERVTGSGCHWRARGSNRGCRVPVVRVGYASDGGNLPFACDRRVTVRVVWRHESGTYVCTLGGNSEYIVMFEDVVGDEVGCFGGDCAGGCDRLRHPPR